MAYTINNNLKKPLMTEGYNIEDFNDNSDIIDAAIGKISELTTIDKTNLVKAINELKADSTSYSTYKLNPDTEGIFTEIQYKRPNGTLIMKSVLSGGTTPKYTTRTETEYEQNGITVKATRIYTVTYDTDGKVVSEVLQ